MFCWSHLPLMHNYYRWIERRSVSLVSDFFEMIRKIAPCDIIFCHLSIYCEIMWMNNWSKEKKYFIFVPKLYHSIASHGLTFALNYLSTTIWTEAIFSIQNNLYKLMTTRHCSRFLEVNFNHCFYLHFHFEPFLWFWNFLVIRKL